MTVTRRRDRGASVRAGIMRHIVGESRVSARRAAKAAPAPAAAPAKPALTAVEEKIARPRMKIGDRTLQAARQMSARLERKTPKMTVEQVLTPFQPAPGVVPKGIKPIAMDEALGGSFNDLMGWAGAGGGGVLNGLWDEGIGFLGYSYLAQLTQRPEYRKISERIATEMTRKWIKLKVVSSLEMDKGDTPAPGEKPGVSGAPDTDPLDDDDETPGAGEGPEAAAAKADEDKRRVRASVTAAANTAQTKKLKELDDELRKLKVKDAFYNMAEWDGWFGRAHLYIDLKQIRDIEAPTSDDLDELKTSIGNGNNSASRTKVRKKQLRAVRCVEPMWVYPAIYNARNPLSGGFYNPERWYANGIEVHRSRLLCFVGRELPDILKPAYAFGGLSLSQMAKPYVDNWLRTRQAVADLIESFSVSGIYTDMQAELQEGGLEAIKRIELFNTMRSNAGAMALDKESEEFFNISTPLGTLDDLQAQSQEQMSSITGIPLVILLGITPKGLNASSEGEIRAFYDWIHAYQESFFRDHLQTVIEFVMLSLWGKIDKDITFEFEPLWSMTEKEIAEIDKFEAETDQIRIDSGVLDPGEVRKAVAAKPESRYADINPEDVPEPPPEPDMGGGDDGGGEGGGAGAGGQHDDGKGPADKAFDGALDSAITFLERVPGETRNAFEARRLKWIETTTLAFDAFNENDHPRADDGKFGAGGSSSQQQPKNGKEASTNSSQNGALNFKDLRQVQGKLGSNKGGKYVNEAGDEFYIKEPATAAHVTNERQAAKLYQLAGAHTLNYRDVEGGEHVATEWRKLEKNNISKFTPAERKEAAKDFAVHAWLSNWDAAGLGGDNQGIHEGKPTTLDVGGSLRYRAQGGEKGKAFGHKVTELDTLRDKSMNPDAAGLFGSMSEDDLYKSVQRVTSIPDDKIREAVGDDKDLADTLIARKKDMAKRFGLMAQDEEMMLAALDAAIDEDDSDEVMMAAALDAEIEDEETDDLDSDGAEEPDEVAPDVFVMAQDEGQFDESKHPRPADGKFGSGGGGAKVDDKSSAIAKVFATKKEHIAHLLTNGTTPKELMTTMGWPSVSMPAQAKSLGMKLEKKDGKYFGTPMTDAEKKAAKEEAVGKQTDKPAQQILKNAGLDKPAKVPEKETASYTPPKDYPAFLGAIADAVEAKDAYAIEGLLKYNPAWAEQFYATASPKGKAALMKVAGNAFLATQEAPQATPDELKKAKKSTPLPLSSSDPDAAQAIKEFNNKYAGKEDLSDAQLNQKVADHKALMSTVKQKEHDAQAAASKKAEEGLKKAAAEKVAKAEKEKTDLAEKFAADPELKTHYEAMEAMFGGGDAAKSYVGHAKAKVEAAGLSKIIRGEDAVPIIAYSGSHYGAVNSELRKGTMTVAQYKFSQSLNAGLEKLPKYTKTTYRKASLTPEQFKSYVPGHIVEERGFTSTSKKQATWSGSHQFTVHGKNGRDISKLSSHPGESEVLFKSGARFHVKSVNGNHIELEEV